MPPQAPLPPTQPVLPTPPVVGVPNEQPQPVEQSPAAQLQHAPQRHLLQNILKTLLLLLVLVAVYAAGIVSYSSFTHARETNAQNTAKSFISALNQGDATVAYANTSPILQNKQSLNQFIADMGNLTASNPKIVSSSITINDQTAVYSEVEDGLPVAGNGRTTGTWTIHLNKAGRLHWQVSSASVQ